MVDIPVRPVVDADRGKLLTASYSKIEVFLNCKHRYEIKYIDKNFEDSKTIPLNLGSICHKVLELKGLALLGNEAVNYDYLKKVLYEGCKEKEKDVWGVNKIAQWFFEDWSIPDNKSNMNYDQKLELFWEEVVPDEMSANDGWKVAGCEVPFEFVYDERVIIHGFIDRIDQKEDGGIRVVDYKTSKASYDKSKMATPLQMIIYGLACYVIFGRLPEEYMYRFVLIDETQMACTKGYLKRGIDKLNKTFDAMAKCEEIGLYPPTPGPLCYYCSFCRNNPRSEQRLNDLCEYYSLWTPENKTFSTNKPFNVLEPRQRNLIF